MSTTKPSIGFCGLGAMGFGMATHFVERGYIVKGFDISQASLDRFEQAGGVPVATLQESAEGNDFYICMVATAQQAQSAIFDDAKPIIKGLPNGATLLLCSTVPATYAQSVAQQLQQLGRSDISLIDCPVSGGAARAVNGTLTIMAGASPEAIAKGQWLLKEMSGENKLFIVDGGIGQGSNMKMVHQVLAAIHILAASEGMGLAVKLGLDPRIVVERVNGSAAWSWMWENRTTRMLNEDYYPGVSALTIILKDVCIVTSQARATTFPVPLSSLAEQVYFSALNQGYGPHDDAGVLRIYHNTSLSQTPQSWLSEDEVNKRTNLVITLLTNIHLLAAAEALSFARHLGIPLDQLYGLAVDAAGGSHSLRDVGKLMIRGLSGNEKNWMGVCTHNLDTVVTDLAEVVGAAQDLKMPLFLGNAVLGAFLGVRMRFGGDIGEAAVLKAYVQ
ncbi:hypothetical protein EJ05DRAFT_349829 [Pseudovirgaria hyperparasitica]|uniref:Oxidoreductase-like protein n=1 Tax=Pseudovirgaria hyperparasitica TaxID=470096 RepID=A0A6A6W9W4_9PEZI|nr:uncharacterized protein EJ05DRAFT_349829 [Pseudovirgaria hyperparasitica]KAF2758377.1 hypothetical protein EJ05DRAFT_349829 [Pseudovirgaria hyperparasitica]